MSVSFASEYKRFRAEQEQLRKQYVEAGMSPEQIDAMYQFDLSQLNRDLAYYRRTQPIAQDYDDFDEDTRNPLLFKFFSRLSYDFVLPEARYEWIENFAIGEYQEKLCALSNEQKELLTLLFKDGLTEAEIAQKYGVTKGAIAQRLDTIRKKIKKVETA